MSLLLPTVISRMPRRFPVVSRLSAKLGPRGMDEGARPPQLTQQRRVAAPERAAHRRVPAARTLAGIVVPKGERRAFCSPVTEQGVRAAPQRGIFCSVGGGSQLHRKSCLPHPTDVPVGRCRRKSSCGIRVAPACGPWPWRCGVASPARLPGHRAPVRPPGWPNAPRTSRGSAGHACRPGR